MSAACKSRARKSDALEIVGLPAHAFRSADLGDDSRAMFLAVHNDLARFDKAFTAKWNSVAK